MPWSRSPLRRRSDRIQAWATLGMILVTLLVAPWVAWRAGSTMYVAEARARAWERQHHRPVAAVLMQDAPARVQDGGAAPPVLPNVAVPARWTDPDGAVRSGIVTVAVGTRAGSVVTVWLDEHGKQVSSPRRGKPTADASVVAALAAAAVIGFLGSVRHIIVWRLDRRRLRSWEAEWLIVGPRWSRR
jgi:hypothetical protein